MIFKCTDECPETAIVQHLESGSYDYSSCGSREAAWEEEKAEYWVQDHPDGADAAEAEFLDTLYEYSKDEILARANEGYGWPEDFGFVIPCNYQVRSEHAFRYTTTAEEALQCAEDMEKNGFGVAKFYYHDTDNDCWDEVDPAEL